MAIWAWAVGRKGCRRYVSALGASHRGAQGLDLEFIKSLMRGQCGFDKPAPERFLMMMWKYIRFDFGESYFRDTSRVADPRKDAGLDHVGPVETR